MKKYLLPENGTYYKANLHMHTVVSDGRMTPEETKELFLKNGYSIVAFTDHDVIAPHHDLTDENFLALTSFETYFNTELFGVMDYGFVQTYHLNFLAKDPDNVVCPAFSERYVERAHSLKYVTEEMRKYDYDREYSVKYMNKIIKEANEAGFLVTYNHPVWSLQDYRDYGDLEGLWGIEIFNTGSVLGGYQEGIQPYNDFLRNGKNVFPIAADDAHSTRTCCGGFVMVNAEKLEYGSVISSLERGDFYASTGPLFKSLYLEDGVLHVECEGAVSVLVNTERREAWRKDVDGDCSKVSFDLNRYLNLTRSIPSEKLPWKPFIRVTLLGEKGEIAATRAYWLDEF